MQGFIEFCKKKKVFVALIAIIAIFAMVLLYRASKARDALFIMDDDHVVGVRGETMDDGVTLSITASMEGATIERDVMVRRSSASTDTDQGQDILMPSVEDEMDTEITRLVKELNQRDEEIIILPETIGDSMTLDWKRNETKGAWILPAIFPPLLLLFMYRGEKDEVKQREKREQDRIVNELPSFNNKLVLLLGSGLVYEESLKRIAVYEEDDGRGLLPIRLGEIVREAESTNRDATKMLSEYAKRKKIPELKRIMSIIMDNRKKGTDLGSKLALEGELLWDKRKKRAEEQGRSSESKLTLPLGIMLIALLIVTAGPALMQI